MWPIRIRRFQIEVLDHQINCEDVIKWRGYQKSSSHNDCHIPQYAWGSRIFVFCSCIQHVSFAHYDVSKWKNFPRYWPFVRGIHRSPVDSPHKGQWRGALMFYLICAWISGWVNDREAGDFRRHRAHYDVIVTFYWNWTRNWSKWQEFIVTINNDHNNFSMRLTSFGVQSLLCGHWSCWSRTQNNHLDQPLTRWSPGDLNAILRMQFSIFFYLFAMLTSSYPLMKMPYDKYHGTLQMICRHWFR